MLDHIFNNFLELDLLFILLIQSSVQAFKEIVLFVRREMHKNKLILIWPMKFTAYKTL